MSKYHAQVDQIRALLESKANADRAASMAAYMKDHFVNLGVSSPERAELFKAFKQAYKPSSESDLLHLMDSLWQQPEREFQYWAMSQWEASRKLIGPEGAAFAAGLVLQKSWWDSVDWLAGNALCLYYKSRPAELDEVRWSWIEHPNMWMNRTAIIVQLKWKEQTRTDWLEEAILPHRQSKEFFHQKAIGWALREYAKTDPQWVLDFVQQHELKPLSVREATKHLR